jgi:hypothetical protein
VTEAGNYIFLGVVAISFVVGYAAVSFVVNKVRESKTKDRVSSQQTADNESFEKHRRHQKQYHQEQERVRPLKEEQKQKAEEEEVRRRTSSSRSSTAKDEAYYGRVLGLHGSVTWPDVRTRYRELAAQYHPDKVYHLGPKLRTVAEQEMKDINEPFEYFKRLYG